MQYYNFTSFAMMLNEMDETHDNIAPTDCRLRPDMRIMEAGDAGNKTKLVWSSFSFLHQFLRPNQTKRVQVPMQKFRANSKNSFFHRLAGTLWAGRIAFTGLLSTH